MKAIEIDNLSKRFGKITALDGVSFSVEEGELFGLLGVNGAGKTTLIRLLCGLSRPTQGNAFVCGHDIRCEMEKIKRLVDVSPQETSVALNLTVRENLCFFADVYGLSEEEKKEKTEYVTKLFHLEKVMDRRAKTLSGGWQRRVSIAVALLTSPKVLFLDEPTLGLDVLARRELWRIIQSIKGKVTVVLTSHYLEEIEYLCDRVAVLREGKLLAVGTVSELKAETGKDSFEDAFVALAEGEVLE